MKRICLLAIGIVIGALSAQAVIIRHDVPDEKYQVDAKAFPQLADLPGVGDGVLISPDWVVTVARAVAGKDVQSVTINGVQRAVARVIIHPGYKPAHPELEEGDAAALLVYENDLDDIALLQLKQPVMDVLPVALYRGNEEQSEIAEIFGKGQTGNGVTGEAADSPRRGVLRRAYTRVEDAEGRWIVLLFHSRHAAQALEGMPGDGDEGAPVLIKSHGEWALAGLVSRKVAGRDLSTYMYFHYGNESYATRISHYAAWIDNTMLAASSADTGAGR